MKNPEVNLLSGALAHGNQQAGALLMISPIQGIQNKSGLFLLLLFRLQLFDHLFFIHDIEVHEPVEMVKRAG